jgi:hypothetical protein
MMADLDVGAERGKTLRRSAFALVAPAHRESEPEAQFRNSAHSGAADSDEMKQAAAR